MQQVLVYATAVITSWFLGSLISDTEALVASIMSVITLRASVHASLNEAFNQALGTVIGATVGILSSFLLKEEILAVATTAITALLLSKILTLGEYGVINILITALIIVGPGQPLENASNRIIGTSIGVVVALALSYWTLPSTPTSRTLEMVSVVYREIGNLFSNGAKTLKENNAKIAYEDFLVNSRALVGSVEKVRKQAEEAIHYAEWSPSASKTATKQSYYEFVALEHCYIQTRTMARTLYDSANVTRKDVSDMYASIMISLSVLMNAKAKIDYYTINSLSLEIKNDLANLYNIVKVDEYKENVSVMTWINSVERILDSISGKSEAITEVSTPIITSNSWNSLNKLRNILNFKR
ncbi:MAG: FUSC family protein [Candidatus Paceibacterota bacterium]